MNSPWIGALRGAALTVPDLAAAEDFYTRVWQLTVAARDDTAIYLRGSGADHHLLALHAAPGTPPLRQNTLRARSAATLAHIADATLAAGGAVALAGHASPDPSGGRALLIRDADGRGLKKSWVTLAVMAWACAKACAT